MTPRRAVRPLAVVAALALASQLCACRAARDPDLDRRVARAAAEEPGESAPAAPVEAEAAGPHDPLAPPPRGIVELRTYSDEEIAAILAAVPGAGPELRVAFRTEAGTIRCTLDAAAAPQAVANFVALATAQRSWRDPDTGEVQSSRFYDGLTFHRCISNFIIQTGNPGSRGAAGPGWTLAREAGIADAYDRPGVMGVVDAGDDSHGSQFFITLRAARNLADDYTPFGTCGDLEVVRAIAGGDKHPAAKEGKSPTRPKVPVRIDEVTLTRGS